MAFCDAATDRRSRHSAWKIHRKGGAAVLQVSAGAKHPVARARQHDDADVLVVMRVAVAAGDAGDHVGIDGVALVRRLMVIRTPARAFRLSRCSCRSLFRSPVCRGLANICGRMTMDCKRELDCGCGLLRPDLVVMERRAAHRSDSFGPGQHVDAAAADMSLVRMDGFGVRTPRRTPSNNLAVSVVSLTLPSVTARHRRWKGLSVLGYHHRRLALAGLRSRRLVETGIEITARWRRGEAERLLIRLLDDGPMIRQRRHLRQDPSPGC